MAIKSKIIIGGGILAVISAMIGWYFLSPLFALNNIKSAVEKKDADAIASFIDFELLKSDLKADMNLAMISEMENDASGMSAAGAALGMAMINPMIDALVSPAGINKMLADAPGSSEQTPSSPIPSFKKLNEGYTIKRVNMSKFRLVPKENDGAGVIFERRGLGWKIVGIDLPPTPKVPPAKS